MHQFERHPQGDCCSYNTTCYWYGEIEQDINATQSTMQYVRNRLQCIITINYTFVFTQSTNTEFIVEQILDTMFGYIAASAFCMYVTSL